ncbi:hypothetical protein H2201_003969 [Coniosporium apollinis]|uniref:Altered inheritance of mitochondria protein 11 n=1 Tax=Coniosporium apollinis TaxID=61459 RepID=A0ABQ9NWZ8_9PEZI|nr:hypothetical protein H2201_003969 [Coniosporium apollinis]
MAFLQRDTNAPSSSGPSEQRPNQISATSIAPPTSPSASHDSSLFSPRSRKQLSLFFAGAAFMTLSLLTTRRALARKHTSTLPRFYQPSNRPSNPVNGPLEAVEALSLATVNVLSFGMMMTGGALWAFDISSMEEMRAKIRAGVLGVDADAGKAAREAEEEMEEWLATVLARKEDKERRRKEDMVEPRREDEGGAGR